METTKVATAVPYHREKEKFLLLKRSSEMEVQPGKWNFPSGKIEDETPQKAALRELEEETNLAGQVLRTGDFFTVENEDGNFLVHPVLVLVDGESELNSEHIDYEWIKPEELGKFETVDGLKEDLRRVDILDGEK